MTEITRYQLYEGVRLTAAHTDRFDYGILSVHLLAPTDRFSAALAASLPYVLLQGTADYPDEDSIRAACEAFGGDIPMMSCDAVGDLRDVNVKITFPDNGPLSKRPGVLEAAAGILGQLLLRPRRMGGRLYGPYVDAAKRRVKEDMSLGHIPVYDKAVQLMYPREPFGIPYGGSASALERVSVGTLTPYHRDLIAKARVEVFYRGSVPDSRLLPIIRGAFHSLKDRASLPAAKQTKLPKNPRTVTAQETNFGAVSWHLPPAEDDWAYAARSVLARYLEAAVSGCECILPAGKDILLAVSHGDAEGFESEARRCVSELAAGNADPSLLAAAQQSSAAKMLGMMKDGLLDDICLDFALSGISAAPADIAALMSVADEKSVGAVAAGAEEEAVLIPQAAVN